MAYIDTSPETKEIPYSLDELENLRQIFSMFDKDNTGYIDSSDISQLMENIGKDPTEGKSVIQALACCKKSTLTMMVKYLFKSSCNFWES
jgi:Ca2+-binding EF-hand superfamily protein